jgi:hypothetical protein
MARQMEMSPRDQNKDKRAAQLVELVQDFRSTASTNGIRLDLLDQDTQLVSQAVFRIDSSIENITIQAAFSPPRTFHKKEIAEVVRERDLARTLPKVAHMSSVCMGLRVSTSDDFTLFRFPDKTSRDDFYACIKVLFMSNNGRR